jgi:hypothetical protein
MGIEPNDHIYSALFNACANSPWPEDGLRILLVTIVFDIQEIDGIRNGMVQINKKYAAGQQKQIYIYFCIVI